MNPTREGVLKAAEKMSEIVPETPLLAAEVEGHRVWCKAESLQPMGAFKLRGAWHRLTELNEAERARGVVAFSSGNHAQGVAWAARRLGIEATIVMPSDAPRAKLDATRAMGAEIVLCDRLRDSREAIAARIAEGRGATVVPSFDDPWIVEGQGSAGVEGGAQMQRWTGGLPDKLIVPCGGGGLSAGIALALPDAEIVICEPEGWDDMTRSLAAGEILPVEEPAPPTLCDALQTKRVSPITFGILSARGARGVAVSEDEVKAAMRFAFARLQLVIEPGGAVALAALLAGKVQPGERTMLLLSGGNVDAALFARVLAEER